VISSSSFFFLLIKTISSFNFRFVFLQVDSGGDDEEQKLVIINKVFPNAFDENQVKVY